VFEMSPISANVASEFCKLCDRAYESWITHKTLFDDNKNRRKNIDKERLRPFTTRLSEITQEYCLLQISKLHDPAIMRGSINLTIDYIVQFGDWVAEFQRIEELKNKLNELWKHLKSARHKAIAHNDLKTIMSGLVFGTFAEGLDNEYFEALHELVDAVAIKWLGSSYSFNDLAKNDVKEFLALLEKV